MQTVGKLLKTVREEKNLNLADVEKATKIRRRFLEALERDDYHSLPSSVAARGFIKNYAHILGLSNDTLQALFRRDFLETDGGQVIPGGVIKPLDEPKTFSWSPTKTVVFLCAAVVLVLGIYFGRQLISLQSGPSLVVSTPIPGQVLSGHTVTVSGQTDPDSTVTVNHQVAQIGPDGAFVASVSLPSGNNVVSVVSVNKQGKSTSTTRQVNIE